MQGTNFPAIAPKFTPTNDGVYILTINGSCNGVVCTSCVYTINVTGCITIPLCNFLPVAFQGQTICTGASTTIGMAAEAGITYSWTSNPIGFTSTLSNPTVNPTVTTTYTLSRTNANPACPAKTATQIITVAPCCDPTCRPSLSVKNLVTNQITICNTTTTMQLNCGQSYDFTRT